MLSYEICGGVLTVSQGFMSLFTAILLRSGTQVITFPVSLPVVAGVCKVFFFLLPSLPPAVSIVGMLGSTG